MDYTAVAQKSTKHLHQYLHLENAHVVEKALSNLKELQKINEDLEMDAMNILNELRAKNHVATLSDTEKAELILEHFLISNDLEIMSEDDGVWSLNTSAGVYIYRIQFMINSFNNIDVILRRLEQPNRALKSKIYTFQKFIKLDAAHEQSDALLLKRQLKALKIEFSPLWKYSHGQETPSATDTTNSDVEDFLDSIP